MAQKKLPNGPAARRVLPGGCSGGCVILRWLKGQMWSVLISLIRPAGLVWIKPGLTGWTGAIYPACESYGGGPVGVDTLAAVLAEQRDMLEEVIEPYLMQTGLLMRTPRGRCLSLSGWAYLGQTPPAQAERQLDLLIREQSGADDDLS